MLHLVQPIALEARVIQGHGSPPHHTHWLPKFMVGGGIRLALQVYRGGGLGAISLNIAAALASMGTAKVFLSTGLSPLDAA